MRVNVLHPQKGELMSSVVNRKHQNKSNKILLDELKTEVHRERTSTVGVVEYLKEVELRKLHLSLGYSSMFAFATEYLGYSEPEAHIRIQAARLGQAVPELSSKLASGEISLSVAAIAQSSFRKENKRRKNAGLSQLSRQ